MANKNQRRHHRVAKVQVRTSPAHIKNVKAVKKRDFADTAVSFIILLFMALNLTLTAIEFFSGFGRDE